MNKEEFNRIKEEFKATIDLESLVQLHGYAHNKSKSNKRYAFYEAGDDKILIYYNSPSVQYRKFQTCNEPGNKGDIFNFLQNKFPDKYPDFKSCFEYLGTIDPFAIIRSANTTTPKSFKREPFEPIPTTLPSEDNYLVRERNIPLSVLYSPSFVQRVLQTPTAFTYKKVNTAVFPLYHNENVVGQFKRSIGSEKHMVIGSNKSIGAWNSNRMDSNVFAVMENPIDAISHQVINASAHNYYATCGSPSQHVVDKIASIPKHNPSARLLLGGDNDIQGQKFNLHFITKYLSLTESPDFQFSVNPSDKSMSLSIIDDKDLEHHKSMFSRLFDRTKVGIRVSDSECDVTASYSKENIEAFASSLINLYSIQTKFEIIKPLEKDFNKDLEIAIKKREIAIDRNIKKKSNMNFFGL